MAWDGEKMTYSRVKKYQELRDGLKDEVAISKENRQEKPQVEEEDDFLSFMKKDKKDEKEVNLEDTLTEAKTFEQMREESSKELDRALKSAKESVGKQDEYNTRMDILNKIREPEKRTIKIDSVEDFATEEFSRGMFINQEKEEIDEEKPKEKMSLMEKLASMSPEEDAKKAEAVLNQEAVEEEIIEEEPVEEKVVEEKVVEEKVVEEEVVEEESDEEQIVEEQEDEEYEMCRAFVIQAQKASTSLLQRQFRIGYNKAARIIDQLESDGVIGPQIGSKPREVYIRGYSEEEI